MTWQVEDIVDTAHTITKLKACLLADGALDVKVVTLLDKIEGRQLEYVPDFVGFRVSHALTAPVSIGTTLRVVVPCLQSSTVCGTQRMHCL